MRILIFGDSIVQGYWDPDGGWVSMLRKHFDTRQLDDLEINDEPNVFNLGISGNSSTEVLERIASETSARTSGSGQPLVIIQIGTNDACVSAGTVRTDIDTYAANLHKIIDSVEPLCSKLIFVGLVPCLEEQTTPVTWGDYTYTNDSIKAYEDRLQTVARERRIRFIPLFDAFQGALGESVQLLTDGLHPSKQGHEFIYEVVKNELAFDIPMQ